MFCCLNCLRTGRTFLTADAPAGPPGNPIAPASGVRWLDVHCHVFNALDLPMNEFIDQTRLSVPGDLPLWIIVAILVGGLRGAAMPAAGEAALLNGSDGPPTPAPTRSLQEAVQAVGEPPDQPAAGPVDGGPHRFAVAPQGGQALLQQAASTIGIQKAPGEALTEEDHAALVAHLQSDPALPRVLAWANSFSSDRNTLVDNLLRQFNGNDQVMLTPSFIDYNRWLGISGDSATERAMSSLTDQLQVMAALARWRARDARRPMPVFSFVPFDPWRFIEDAAHGRDIVTLARPYIEQGSVLGFKLYPAMGFAPTGNAERDATEFPQALQNLVGGHPGPELDRAMDALFSYCAINGVPVMAHCGDTNFPVRDTTSDAHFGGPEYWQPVLARYPDLRLNLGHFGGIWAFGNSGPQGIRARQWADYIARFMQNHANLYADLAFGDTLLDAENSEHGDAVEFLKQLIGDHPILKQRLMYGSDWEMVGMAKFGGTYASALLPVLRDLFGEQEADVRWRNAARYLGLGAADQTRQRLQAFLVANGANPDMLAVFDPAPEV